MIKAEKSFFDPYYKEEFYKDAHNNHVTSAIAHLAVACFFGAFIVSSLFFLTKKDTIEQSLLSFADTVSNQYPYSYKFSIDKNGKLDTNINPVSFIDTAYVGKEKVNNIPSKLITVDSLNTLESYEKSRYDAYYVLLQNKFVKTVSDDRAMYHGYEGTYISRSNVDIFLSKVRSLTPFVPGILAITIFGLFAIGYPFFYMANAVVVAGILWLVFKYAFKEKISYQQAYTLSIFAGGTVFLFQSLMVLFPVVPLFSSLLVSWFSFVTMTTLLAVAFVALMHRNATYFPVKKAHVVKFVKKIKKVAKRK